MTFAATYGEPAKPFLVQALPALWRAEERHRENPQLERLMRSVFVHELTHAVQTAAFGDRLTQLEKEHAIADLDDDIVQHRFANVDGYSDAYRAERDALYRVANEANVQRRRELAKEALQLVRARHERYFTKENAHFRELDELFLGMEGAANWAAYRAAVRDGATHAEAIALINKSGRYWTQDEGLGLFLAIDALLPGEWQSRITGDKVTGAWALLEEGASRGSRTVRVILRQ